MSHICLQALRSARRQAYHAAWVTKLSSTNYGHRSPRTLARAIIPTASGQQPRERLTGVAPAKTNLCDGCYPFPAAGLISRRRDARRRSRRLEPERLKGPDEWLDAETRPELIGDHLVTYDGDRGPGVQSPG
jgi:hypothetical protein